MQRDTINKLKLWEVLDYYDDPQIYSWVGWVTSFCCQPFYFMSYNENDFKWKKSMDFKWDETKAYTNQKKHGVSFIEASEIFDDDYSSCVHDPDHSYEEERYLIFGVSSKGTYLVVSYTERFDTIRIISARRMTRQERKAYEQ